MDRHLLRLVLSIVVVGSALFVTLGFWLVAPDWNPTVFGRYTIKWFAGTLIVSVIILAWTRRLLKIIWSPARSDGRTSITRSAAKRLLLGTMTAALTLLFAEVGLHVADYPARDSEYVFAAGTARSYHALLQHVERSDFDGKLARTYRGRFYDLEAKDAVRVLCLGGSTTWGHGVSGAQAWPAQLEEMLQAKGHDAEVINAALPWYTSAQSLVNYALQMRHYDPDVVVILHGINDLTRSFPWEGEPDVEADYGSYQGPMRRIIDMYERSRDSDWRRAKSLLESSAVYRLVCLQSSAVYRFVCQGTALDRRFYSALRSETKRDEVADSESGLEAFETIASFRANMEYLTRLCRDDGRVVILCTQPHVYGRDDLSSPMGVEEQMRTTFLRNLGGAAIARSGVRTAMWAITDATLEIAREQGAVIADPQQRVGSRTEYFLDDFHLNAKGHSVVANVVGDVLIPILGDTHRSNHFAGARRTTAVVRSK